jgi:PAS domain S-box-containing protein
MPSYDPDLLASVFGELDLGVIVLDANSAIIGWNSWLERASGIAAADAMGKPLVELFPLTRLPRFDAAISAALESGVSSMLTHSLHRGIIPLRTAAGRKLVHDVSVRPLGPKSNRICLIQIDDVTIAAHRDILLRQRHDARYDELKIIQEQLRQAQKMEAVGQLTGGIAHDFNNLLQGIIGSLDRVQHRIAQGRIGEVDRFLIGAVESANRAAALTHRLLAFSRRQPIDPKPVNANLLIGGIEELLRRSIGENISLRMNLAPALWLARCDTNQLENALLNLVINARDAMPNGGEITIETANLELDERAALMRDLTPAEFVSIKVKDNGVGMPESVKSHAFDPFYTTKPIGQGTGLGLSMIYGFVRQSEGSVTIDSAPGRGTQIEICLPRFTGKITLTSNDAQNYGDEPADRGQIVLVVEDEPVVRLLVVETLEEHGYRALEAANGETALRILQSSQRVDLVVTDIGLPGLNGRQLADAGRCSRPTLKVLFMTGYADRAASSNFLQPGMEIIAKPFKMDALAKQVRQLIDN